MYDKKETGKTLLGDKIAERIRVGFVEALWIGSLK